MKQAYEISELVQMYKEAKDKNKQIGILADMAQVSRGEMADILRQERCFVENPAKRHWTEAELSMVRELIGDGVTYKEIAKILGKNAQAIADAVRRFGLKKNVKANEPQTPKQEPKKAAIIEKPRADERDSLIGELREKIIVLEDIIDTAIGNVRLLGNIAGGISDAKSRLSRDDMGRYISFMVSEMISLSGDIVSEMVKAGGERD